MSDDLPHTGTRRPEGELLDVYKTLIHCIQRLDMLGETNAACYIDKGLERLVDDRMVEFCEREVVVARRKWALIGNPVYSRWRRTAPRFGIRIE